MLDLLRSRAREPERATLVARGVAFLTVVALLVTWLFLLGRGTFADRMDATVLVDSAGGALVEGSDVKYQGVLVGKVAGIRDAADSAGKVEIAVDLVPSVAEEVPGNVVARVLPASVFGTSFVDLVTRRPADRPLQAGQVIEQDRTRATLEVQAVLDGLDRVVDALGPAELATTLEGLAGALDGNGERLGRTVVTLERYLSRLNPEMPRVRHNLDLLSTNLEAFARYAPDLFEATEDALVAARTLVEQEGEFAAVARSGSRTFGSTATLLSENEQRLVDTIVHSAVVVDALYDGRVELVQGARSAVDLARGFVGALSHGPHLQVDANLVREEEPGYGPGDCPTYGPRRGREC